MSGRGVFDSIHVSQQQGWDCGVACCRMALKFAGVAGPNTSCLEAFLRPVWTIDILEALLKHDVACEMITTCFGTNPDHKDTDFYDQHRDLDELRVNEKFATAQANDWPLSKVIHVCCTLSNISFI
jgi:hypothetical protein